MRTETKIAKAKADSEGFGRYAEVMLEEIPDMSLPVLRDCYKHHATAGEFRAHLERCAIETAHGASHRNTGNEPPQTPAPRQACANP